MKSHELAALHAKLFAAPDEERDAAAGIAIEAAHSIRASNPRAARPQSGAAAACGAKRRCSLRIGRSPGRRRVRHALVDGQVDLAYETDDGWVVVDFKTDIEIASAQDAYKQQVALYVEAVRRATGQPATGVLLARLSPRTLRPSRPSDSDPSDLHEACVRVLRIERWQPASLSRGRDGDGNAAGASAASASFTAAATLD